MLYWLSQYDDSPLRIFKYLTFRSAGAAAFAFMICKVAANFQDLGRSRRASPPPLVTEMDIRDFINIIALYFTLSFSICQEHKCSFVHKLATGVSREIGLSTLKFIIFEKKCVFHKKRCSLVTG